MKRKLVCSLVSLCLLANSAAQAQGPKPQVKDVHQTIEEARSILQSNAYRIDKELVAGPDSTFPAEDRFMGALVSGILGDSFAGLSGSSLGVDTWGVIIMDVEGYEKAKEKVLKSRLAQNSCVQQGIAFLDTVKQFKVINAAQIDRLAILIDRLKETRAQQALLVGQSSGPQQNLNNIEAFLDQPVSAIRIDWQNYLAEGKNSNCVALAKSQQDANQLKKQLIERITQNSSVMPQNSMHLLGSLSFTAAPFKKLSQAEAKAMSAVQSRAFVSQVKVLKELREKGYIEFKHKNIFVNERMGGEIVLEVTPKALKEIENYSSGFADKSQLSFQGTSSLVGNYLAVGVVVATGISIIGGEMFSIEGGERFPTVSVAGGITLSVGVAAGIATFILNNNQKHEAQQTKFAVEQVLSQKAFNDSMNRVINEAEQLYDLQSRDVYMKNRSRFISDYKSSIASEVVQDILQNKDKRQFDLKSSYEEYLMQSQIISKDEVFATKTIVGFLSSKKIYLKDIDLTHLLKKKMNALQVSMEFLLNDADLKAEDREEVLSLKAKIDREVLGLNMLTQKE